jgi:transposase, IS5 family
MHRKSPSQCSFSEPWLDAQPARELAAMSALLAEDATTVAQVEQGLEAARRRFGRTWSSGGLRGDQVLRAMVLRQMHGFTYRALAFHLADSRTYRSFCRLGWRDPSPSKSALAAVVAKSASTRRSWSLRSMSRRIPRCCSTVCGC